MRAAASSSASQTALFSTRKSDHKSTGMQDKGRDVALHLSSLSHPITSTRSNKIKVTQLARYPIKGLSPDMLSKVYISSDDFIGTFPDDRRFALLQEKQASKNIGVAVDDDSSTKFDSTNPKWIHKENFLCAFTEPEFMASFDCKYEIKLGKKKLSDNKDVCEDRTKLSYCLPNDDIIKQKNIQYESIQRVISVYQRSFDSNPDTNQTLLLGPIDLNTSYGRNQFESFFMEQYKRNILEKNNFPTTDKQSVPFLLPTLKCVSATSTSTSKSTTTNQGKKNLPLSKQHIHQFGNTRSGVKNNNNDTRTIHIINLETVKEFSSKIGFDINPMRFRPNLVISGLEPWKEFDLVGKKLQVIHSGNDLGSVTNSDDDKDNDDSNHRDHGDRSGLVIEVLSTTVRCAGVGIDPTEHPSERSKLDIPDLLMKYYPQYGPYLGVYATIRTTGSICIGDTLQIMK